MPWAPPRGCLEPGCHERQAGARCALHERASPRNHRGVPRQARGLGAEYDRLRPLVLERDGYRCRLRLPGCTVVASTADHVVPRSAGGRSTMGNLRAACGHCNSSRGARPLEAIA